MRTGRFSVPLCALLVIAVAARNRTTVVDGIDGILKVARSGEGSTGNLALNTELAVTLFGVPASVVRAQPSAIETVIRNAVENTLADKQLSPSTVFILNETIREGAASLNFERRRLAASFAGDFTDSKLRYRARQLAASDTSTFNAFVVAQSVENKKDREELECGLTVNEQGFETEMQLQLQQRLGSVPNDDIGVPDIELINALKACKKCRACAAGVFNGLVAQHFVGLVLMILFLPLGLDYIFKIYFGQAYTAGTPYFFLRLFILEFLDMLCIGLVFEFDKQVEPGVLVLPVLCNTGAMFITLRGFRDGRVFARRRAQLVKALEDAVQGLKGEQHISDQLQSEVERFNDEAQRRYDQMKNTFMILIGMEIGDVEFVGVQYFNFCERTACSYFGQLATVLSMALLVNSLFDFRELRFIAQKGGESPELIDTGKSKHKSSSSGNGRLKAAAKQVVNKLHAPEKNQGAASAADMRQAYQHVRGLLDTMMRESEAALYVFANPDIGTAPMSLEIHEMNMSPATDPRADACVWAILVARACWRTVCVERAPMSLTGLHLIAQLCTSVHKQLDGFAERVKLEILVEVLQRAAACLPQAVREELVADSERWERVAGNGEYGSGLDPFAVRLISGINAAWEGEFVPIALTSDGVVEYRRARSKKKDPEIALYRDPMDHNWKIGEVGADGERQLPRYWNVSPTSDQPPGQQNWFHNAMGGASTGTGGDALNAIRITVLPVDTYAVRSATSHFLLRPDIQQQIEMLSAQSFDVDIYDDALAQWMYMKATQGAETLNSAAAKDVALAMVQKLKRLGENDRVPEWAIEAYEALKGKDDPAQLADIFATLASDELLRNHDTISVPKGTRICHVLVCSASELRDGSAVENILRATLDSCVPVERVGPDSNWPLRCVLKFGGGADVSNALANTKPMHGGGGATATQRGMWRHNATRARERGSTQLSIKVCGRVYLLPSRFFVIEQLKHRSLYTAVVLLYVSVFMHAARLINTSNEELDAITLFGLPPQYDMTDPLQAVLVPLIYANMHCNLLTFALLPLPMCRCTIKNLSSSPTISSILHLDHVQFWHRILGYFLIIGVLTGGVLWWFALGHSCVANDVQKSCNAFHTPANEALGMGAFESYFNIYDNLAAVLFLRELVITSFIAIFSTALLVYPLGGDTKALPIGWIQSHAWELFYYTHLAFFTTLVTLAMTSRFDVFKFTLPSWALYYGDVLWMRLFHTMKTTSLATYSGDPTHFVHLKVQKTGRFLGRCYKSTFHFKAGQTAFINIPAISKLEWHPFSIASAPTDNYVEFLIDAGKYGKNSWTGQLWHMLAERQLATNFETNLMGPCGSAFQTTSDYYGVVLVGGGSGLTSSLSVLRDIIAHHRQPGGGAKNPKKVWMIWVTRHVDSMIWCWGALKSALEGENGTQEDRRRNVAELSSWFDISIYVTGCARSQDERAALDRLVASEENGSPAAEGLAGQWLVRGDHLRRSRVKSWRDKFVAVHSTVPPHASVKVLFCGPTPMATDIGEAARSIKGFDAQFSSENFNEGKRPTPKFDAHLATGSGAVASPRIGLDNVYETYKSSGDLLHSHRHNSARNLHSNLTSTGKEAAPAHASGVRNLLKRFSVADPAPAPPPASRNSKVSQYPGALSESTAPAGMPERRAAPDGTGSYTKEEFIAYYRGTAEWDAAAPGPAPPVLAVAQNPTEVSRTASTSGANESDWV